MIALDTETTGLMRPSATELNFQPFMIEICAIKFNKKFEPVSNFTSLVKPPVPISEEITKITNITNSMVENAPTFIDIYDDLCDFFLGEEYMFAHNCAFDRSVLLCELKRFGLEYNFPWPIHHICTVEKSFAIKNKRLKLSALYEIATGKNKIENAHRAESDVLAMIECIKFLAENDFL